MAELYHTIYTHKELNPDLLIALFLLKEYGDQKYPGIHQAHIDILDALPEEENGTSLEHKGIISFGFNDGLFIATESRSYSQQVANTLGLADGIAVETFISIAEQKKQNEHGDFYIILNGIIEEYSDKPNKTLKASYPVLKAHFDALQEELAPIATEYMNKLNAGEVMAFVAPQKRNELRVIAISSNNPEMAQFLHNQEEIQADVVCQKYESGHVSITTRYQSHANLDETIAILRIEEARKKKLPFDQINWNDLRMEDRMEHLEEWKYNKEEQTIFNTKALGKPNKGATLLELKDLKLILQIGLDKSKLDRKCPPVGCRGKKCKFYFYNLDRCQRRRKNKDIDQKKSDLKSSVQVLQDDAVVKLDD